MSAIYPYLSFIGAALIVGGLVTMWVFKNIADRNPLYDENELPIDEVQDDPRPGEVLRAAWADRTAQEPVSPITGKPITIRNHADLSAAVAARHRLGDVARIGWQTRRARHG